MVGESSRCLSAERPAWKQGSGKRADAPRLSDDAFKSADYPPEIRQRYITKLRDKIREGLALRTAQETGPGEPR